MTAALHRISHALVLAGCGAIVLGGCSWARAADLAPLVEAALAVETPTQSPLEYQRAAAELRRLRAAAVALDSGPLTAAERLDRELLLSHLETRLFEIETLRLHEVVPIRYYQLSATDELFLRPCEYAEGALGAAAAEMERLPEILANGRRALRVPARTWTENAIYQAGYARILLGEEVPRLCVEDAALRERLDAAASIALAAVDDWQTWLRDELLPRSTRTPAWRPEEIEFYQFEHEQLTAYGVDRMLEVAAAEEVRLTSEMEDLARLIHPSGDLATVWSLMKQEAPPWEGVLPMAQRYVDLMTAWLRGPGARLLTLPDFDYGAVLNPPMARRTLSFGGAYYGPTIGGRISGYYVLTPLEPWLDAEEAASRLLAYNPYWTDVISYHEWVGHNVQRAAALAHESTPIRRAYGSHYLSQAWSFYLEGLMEEEGFYQTLPYMEELKTRMARRQMRMWRVQRILTKLKMARGEMTFDEAVEAYVERIGMERANAFIEVQRDSQSPSPPGREIIGELYIRELREAYRERQGEAFDLREFHDRLLSYGELPLPVIRRLMLGEAQ